MYMVEETKFTIRSSIAQSLKKLSTINDDLQNFWFAWYLQLYDGNILYNIHGILVSQFLNQSLDCYNPRELHTDLTIFFIFTTMSVSRVQLTVDF